MKPIDADAIDKRYVPIAPVLCGDDVHYEWVAFIEDINKLPTVDAVPVIRCKDCRYFRPDDDCNQCALWEYGKTDREAFCSYAMRRGEE